MGKIILTSLLAILLFAPSADLQAGKDQQFLKGKPFSDLNDRIDDINKQIADLKLQVGDLPPDLAKVLASLQSAVDMNSGDVLVAFVAIDGILDDIELIIARLSALEQSGSPELDLLFSGYFFQNLEARFSLKFDWANFKSNATGSFSSIEIKNDLGVGGSAVCADSVVATQIVNALNTLVPDPDSLKTFTCYEPTLEQNVNWNVGEVGGEVELNAQKIVEGVDALVGDCGVGAVVRPLNPSRDWGGVGADFGGASGTCNALSQTLEVVLTR